MKRALIASILGIAASVASSYGQGYIAFLSYELAGPSLNIPAYSGVTYGGQYVGSSWSAELLYQFGTQTSFTLANGDLAGNPMAPVGFYPGSHTGGSPLTDGAGTFIGPTVVIPGYTSGAVTFEVEVLSAASGPNAQLIAYSAPFTIPSLQTNNLLVLGDVLNLNASYVPQGFQSFDIPVPEPSSLALLGLGSAALMILRRRK